MNRLHVHIGVEDLQKSIGFYSAMFGAEPAKVKTDYARWLLDDPSVNFAISTKTKSVGIEHLGLEVESMDELEAVRERLQEAQRFSDAPITDESDASCCYARGEKSWAVDPSGVSWESFYTKSDVDGYFGSITQTQIDAVNQSGPCC